MEFANNFFTHYSIIKPLRSNIIKISRSIFKYFLLIIRSVLLVKVLSIGIITSMLLRIVIIFVGKWRFINLNTKYVVKWTSRILLVIFGVKINKPRNLNFSQSIIVSNHWGYLDSLILMAYSPCLVISNVDVGKMPIVGKVMTSMGFVFVDRNRNRTIPYIIEKTTDIIRYTDLNIAFFPEGRTGDGFQLNKFNSSFFELARTTNKNVVPVVISIESINKEIADQNNINKVVFHNSSENIINHLFKLLQLKSIEINVINLPQISYYDIFSEKLSRKDICKIAEERIGNYIDNKK